jgi:AcrR family transcriptional regulator
MAPTTTRPTRTRRRAGGRSERIRQQVARACLDLLGEGRVDFGPTDVAARSGVTRATIHRWWPTKPDLLREALAEHTGTRLDPPDTGTWAGDLDELARRMAAFFADPVEVSQNAIMASGQHPEYDDLAIEHFAPLFEAWTTVIERARARGELRAGVDADAIVMALASPLLVVPLVFHRALTAAEIRAHVDLLLAGTRAPG